MIVGVVVVERAERTFKGGAEHELLQLRDDVHDGHHRLIRGLGISLAAKRRRPGMRLVTGDDGAKSRRDAVAALHQDRGERRPRPRGGFIGGEARQCLAGGRNLGDVCRLLVWGEQPPGGGVDGPRQCLGQFTKIRRQRPRLQLSLGAAGGVDGPADAGQCSDTDDAQREGTVGQCEHQRDGADDQADLGADGQPIERRTPRHHRPLSARPAPADSCPLRG